MVSGPSSATSMPTLAAISSRACAKGIDLKDPSGWRFMGLELTPGASTQITGPLFDLSGCDYCIIDRDVIHGSDCVPANFLGICTTAVGVQVLGTHLAIINSSIYDITCPQGTGAGVCSESHAISGGVGGTWHGIVKMVNNFLVADTENYFFGGGAAANLLNAGSPNGVQGPTGTGWNVNGVMPTDVEMRRNYLFRPLTWMMGSYVQFGTRLRPPQVGASHAGPE